MNQRQKTSLVIIVVGLLLIAAIVYFFFLKGPMVPGTIIDEPEVPLVQLPTGDEGEVNPGDRPRNRIVYDISKEDEHKINQTDVAKIGEVFAARLGTYSNQSNYSNYEDINIFMTATMRDWARDYVEKTRRDNPYDGNYFGIITTPIYTKVTAFDDAKGEAEIIISTQRRETVASEGENVYNQDLRLNFLKVNNQWLVDGAYWLK